MEWSDSDMGKFELILSLLAPYRGFFYICIWIHRGKPLCLVILPPTGAMIDGIPSTIGPRPYAMLYCPCGAWIDIRLKG